MIARDVKRRKLAKQFRAKREALKAAFVAAEDPMEKLEVHFKLQQLPRNSAPNRQRNRCWATGKPRGVVRDFGLCRNQLRQESPRRAPTRRGQILLVRPGWQVCLDRAISKRRRRWAGGDAKSPAELAG